MWSFKVFFLLPLLLLVTLALSLGRDAFQTVGISFFNDFLVDHGIMWSTISKWRWQALRESSKMSPRGWQTPIYHTFALSSKKYAPDVHKLSSCHLFLSEAKIIFFSVSMNWEKSAQLFSRLVGLYIPGYLLFWVPASCGFLITLMADISPPMNSSLPFFTLPLVRTLLAAQDRYTPRREFVSSQSQQGWGSPWEEWEAASQDLAFSPAPISAWLHALTLQSGLLYVAG